MTNERFLLVHIIVILYWCKRCCHPRIPLPSWRGRQTVELLQCEAPEFIGPDLWPPVSSDLSPAKYQIWGISGRIMYIRCRFETWMTWGDAWQTLEMASHKALWMMPLTEWPKKLQACVCERGSYCERLLQYLGLGGQWLCIKTKFVLVCATVMCKLLLCSSYFFQGTVATVCRWNEKMNKYYVAYFFCILCAKYRGNRPAETTVEQKCESFLITVYFAVSMNRNKEY